MLFRWWFRPCAVPLPQTDPPHLRQRRACRWHLLGREWRNRATGLDRPDKGIIPLTGGAAWLLLSFFIIFGYKVIQLKGSDWNKAMWEERGVQCMMGGASRCCLLLFDGCRKKQERWESDPNTGDNVAAAGPETYFLLWAGGFSPGSQSSSAWTCRSWWLLKCLACRSLLQICKQTSENSGCVGLRNTV